jgi:hypothetical protein
LGLARDTLTSDALDWALTHITRFGDTDIFPAPFEFDCIKHAWSWLKPELEKIDLTGYRTRSTRRLLVPKPGGGFRVATQLDPIDAVIYAAISYEAAPQIEASRVPRERRIACSYRVELDPKGRLFTAESGWPEYHSHSKDLGETGLYTHVLVADIADFYNQIYSHRVQSALELANLPTVRANNVERFLLSLTAKQSRGVPVGPSASILFAEASLMDIDNFLLRKGVPFTRFVDDFRIFCASKKGAVRVYHDLVEYVYTAHRLILEPWKSRIMPIERFIEAELIDPGEVEQSSRIDKIREVIERILFESGYSVGEDDLLSEDKDKATRDNLVELFEECVAKKPLHLGLARYLLRRATRLRTIVLVPLVFDNLTKLRSVFRDVIKYLAVCVPKKTAPKRGEELVAYLKNSDYGQIPFLRLWGMELFQHRPDMLNPEAALDLAQEFAGDLGSRPAALMARIAKRMDWVRAQKEIWSNYSPWERRAVIFAGFALPGTERRVWLDLVAETTEDMLERAIAQFAKDG